MYVFVDLYVHAYVHIRTPLLSVFKPVSRFEFTHKSSL